MADIYLNGSGSTISRCRCWKHLLAVLPVITTDAGGIPGIVSHERTGLMVQRGDYEGLALKPSAC